MSFSPPPFKENWRWYLRWISLGIIAASIMALIRYCKDLNIRGAFNYLMRKTIIVLCLSLILLVLVGCSPSEQPNINNKDITSDKNINIQDIKPEYENTNIELKSKKYTEKDAISAIAKGKAIANDKEQYDLFNSKYEWPIRNMRLSPQIFAGTIDTPYGNAVTLVKHRIEANESYTLNDVKKEMSTSMFRLYVHLLSPTNLTLNDLDMRVSYDGISCKMDESKVPFLYGSLLSSGDYGQGYAIDWLCYDEVYDKKLDVDLIVNGQETKLIADMSLYR